LAASERCQIHWRTGAKFYLATFSGQANFTQSYDKIYGGDKPRTYTIENRLSIQ
jgi:hypothetical protein